jgi:hypothetical protein
LTWKREWVRPTDSGLERQNWANPGTLWEGMYKIESAGGLFSTTYVSKRNGDIIIYLLFLQQAFIVRSICYNILVVAPREDVTIYSYSYKLLCHIVWIVLKFTYFS